MAKKAVAQKSIPALRVDTSSTDFTYWKVSEVAAWQLQKMKLTLVFTGGGTLTVSLAKESIEPVIAELERQLPKAHCIDGKAKPRESVTLVEMRDRAQPRK